MNLAVIVVSYNTCDLLRASLNSVIGAAETGAAGLDVDIVVVDNASHDGSAEMVAADFPQVTLLTSGENLGFTAANNLALSHLGFGSNADQSPDFVLLLNPDAEVLPDTLDQMLAVFSTNPGAGVCGANLSYGDGAFQHGAFHFPSLFQVALDFFPLAGMRGAHRLHNSGLNGRYSQQLWQGDQPFQVDFVLGAAMMVRGAAIHDVGLLDERFFMYCEEMDWCLRMQEGGWAVYAAPEARVIHHEARSSRQVRWSAYERLWRSRFQFYAKHANRYPPATLAPLRALVRLALGYRTRQAQGRFADGQITGVELSAELDAYRAIRKL